jgi:hypothetical protein
MTHYLPARRQAPETSLAGGELSASYNFINFNKDRVNVSFSMGRGEYVKYLAGYGYSDSDLAALKAWREKARNDAWYSIVPAKGDMFVRYEGLEYVLVEPAGPAWLEPGQAGRHTAELLAGSDGYQIEPFF